MNVVLVGVKTVARGECKVYGAFGWGSRLSRSSCWFQTSSSATATPTRRRHALGAFEWDYSSDAERRSLVPSALSRFRSVIDVGMSGNSSKAARPRWHAAPSLRCFWSTGVRYGRRAGSPAHYFDADRVKVGLWEWVAASKSCSLTTSHGTTFGHDGGGSFGNRTGWPKIVALGSLIESTSTWPPVSSVQKSVGPPWRVSRLRSMTYPSGSELS